MDDLSWLLRIISLNLRNYLLSTSVNVVTIHNNNSMEIPNWSISIELEYGAS